jgi:hypothetical protein
MTMRIFKKTSKVGNFRKITDIFITALAAQTAQKAGSLTIKSLLTKDWVFRLLHHLALAEFFWRFLWQVVW